MRVREWLGRRRWWVAGCLVVVLATVTIGWLAWPRPARPPAPPRARVYLDFTACLLTDAQGIVADPAKTVWSGMQSASLATRAKVQYLAVVGPQTVDNAAPFLLSLIQGNCSLVLAVGAAPVQAAEQLAQSHPKVQFLVVDGAPATNITRLASGSPADLGCDVESRITAAVRLSPGP